MRISLKIQKYICFITLIIINTILSVTFIKYTNKWYVYLFILALGSILNSASSILLIIKKMLTKNDSSYVYRTNPKKYLYVIPCYNESEEELTLSINSLVNQERIINDVISFIIICDGKAKGVGNEYSTDIILKNLLMVEELPIIYNYYTADVEINQIEIYNGKYKNIPYLLMIKLNNFGKRDSLVIVRRLCYIYNESLIDNSYESENSFLSKNIIQSVKKYFKKIYNDKIDFIIGIDADTIFDYRCSYELIKAIEHDDNIKGCVGFVDIDKSMNKCSLYVLYQYAEYVIAQCLKRQAQSNITHKVSCLSGCNQILKICKETCGEEILNKFNYLPRINENIFNHIRSYASEDRNHVCLMLSMYPYVKTVQTLKAIAWTKVPTSINVFLSQRRRWSLGASTNDMLLVYFSGINIFERISAFVNIMIYLLNPFIFIATIMFLMSLKHATYLALYLSILMIIPIIYYLMIPIFIKPMIFRETLYYYISLIFYFMCGSIITLIIYCNSIINMDIIKWGKTRAIELNNIIVNNTFIEQNNDNLSSQQNGDNDLNSDENGFTSDYITDENIFNTDENGFIDDSQESIIVPSTYLVIEKKIFENNSSKNI
jgi:chitin synthase